MKRDKMKLRPGIDQLQTFPNYKIQVWNGKIGVWVDIQRKFGSLDDLADYAFSKLDWNIQTRMVTVKAEGECWIDPDFDAFGEPR